MIIKDIKKELKKIKKLDIQKTSKVTFCIDRDELDVFNDAYSTLFYFHIRFGASKPYLTTNYHDIYNALYHVSMQGWNYDLIPLLQLWVDALKAENPHAYIDSAYPEAMQYIKMSVEIYEKQKNKGE